MIYGAQQMAASFRTVRQNTIQIAEDIPEDQYSYRATPDVQTIGEELAHLAASTSWQPQMHGVDKKTFMTFEDFGGYIGRANAIEQELKTKAQILSALKTQGDVFAQFLDGLSDEQLAESISFPSPAQPSSRTVLRCC